MKLATKLNLPFYLILGVLFVAVSVLIWGCEKTTSPTETRTIVQEEIAANEENAEPAAVVVSVSLGGECHLDLAGQPQCSDGSVITADGIPVVGSVLWKVFLGAVPIQSVISTTNAGIVTFLGLAPGTYLIRQTVSYGGVSKVQDYSVTVP